MKKTPHLLAAFTSLALAAQVSEAAKYQYQPLFSHSQSEIQILGFEIENELQVAGLTYYFDKVSDHRGPLAEAAFLERTGSLSALYTRITSEGISEDDTGYTLFGDYVFSNGIIVDASYSDNDTSESYQFGFGKYISRFHTASLRLQETKQILDDQKDRSVSVEIKHVANFGNGTALSFTIEPSFIDLSNGMSGYAMQTSLTYYPTFKIGIGLDTDFQSVDSYNIASFGVQFNLFLTSHIGLEFRYAEQEDILSSINLITGSIVGRF